MSASLPAAVGGSDDQGAISRFAIRITEIPLGQPAANLVRDLEALKGHGARFEASLERLSVEYIARNDTASACTTIDVETTLEKDRLISLVKRASSSLRLPYEYDCNFDGITPVYEPSNEAKCE